MARRDRRRETLVIDAYNLLHRLRARLTPEGADERAWLEALLRRYRAARRTAPRIILVYDGGALEAGSRRERERGFEVRYARDAGTADDVILDLARRARAEDGMVVVTSDVHDIARNLRGLPVGHRYAEDFAEDLARLVRAATAASEKPAGVAGDDVAWWAEEFGFPRRGRRR